MLLLLRWSLILGLLLSAYAEPLYAQSSDEAPVAPLIPKTEPGPSKPEEKKAIEGFFQKGPYTFIPLPAFSYARNERYWVGAFMPILKEDQKHELSTIITPQYLFNPLVGQTGTINVLRYPSDTAQYEMTASFSERIARDIDFRYKDVGAGGGRYILGVDATWFKNPCERFFGFGNHAQELRETNYTLREG